MKLLEVRRHALTKKDDDGRGRGSHLSQQGVDLARAAGRSLSGVEYVAVGGAARHLETAVAMGYAVNEQVDWPSGYVVGEVEHHDQWTWSYPFVRYAELVARGNGLAAVASQHLAEWTRLLGIVPEGGAALVISSGGSIEPVLAAAMPEADPAQWGGPLHHLEGATLEFDEGRFTRLTMRRRADLG